jgi:hypothetical protein
MHRVRRCIYSMYRYNIYPYFIIQDLNEEEFNKGFFQKYE